MKKQNVILTAIALIATLTAGATVRTVSNHPLGGAQYATLAAAYNAASNGDTIKLEGTAIEYDHGSISGFAKSLVFIGQGINTQKQLFSSSKIGKVSTGGGSGGSANINFGASGSKFYGIEFTGGTSNDLSIYTTGIYFENCKFSRNVYMNNGAANITFVNCVFSETVNITSATVTTIAYNNCIFNNNVTGAVATASVMFDHCLFLNTGNTFSSATNYTIKNSIFMNSTVSGISTSSFQNNMFRISQPVPPAGNFDAGGNTSGSNPLFVTYTLGTLYSTAHDYHLQAGSPAIGTATDATDLGLHGGIANFSEQGEALIVPVVRSMNISTPTALPNGTISVQVSASKPDDN